MIGLNNKKIGFIVDSSSNIPDGKYEDVKVVPLCITVTKNNVSKTYKDGVDMFLPDLKKALDDKDADVKTSQANMMDMMKACDEMCPKYDYVIVMPIHEKISGNINSWRMLKDEYPNLIVLMTLDITLSFTWTLEVFKDYLKTHECNEASLQDYVNKEIIPHRFGFLMITDLKQMVKGGRVSGLKAAIAKLFKINPVIFMDKNGLEQYSKCKTYDKYFDIVDEYIARTRPGQKITRFFLVTPIGNEKVEKEFIETFKRRYHIDKYDLTSLPTIVVAHSGANHVATYFDVR